MEIVRDDIWLCCDCLMYAVNGDLSGVENDERVKEVEDGVASLGPHLVPDFDSETEEGIADFSWLACDACGTHLGGSRHRFAVLGEVECLT